MSLGVQTACLGLSILSYLILVCPPVTGETSTHCKRPLITSSELPHHLYRIRARGEARVNFLTTYTEDGLTAARRPFSTATGPSFMLRAVKTRCGRPAPRWRPGDTGLRLEAGQDRDRYDLIYQGRRGLNERRGKTLCHRRTTARSQITRGTISRVNTKQAAPSQILTKRKSLCAHRKKISHFTGKQLKARAYISRVGLAPALGRSPDCACSRRRVVRHLRHRRRRRRVGHRRVVQKDAHLG